MKYLAAIEKLQQCALVDRSELTREVRDRHVGQGLSHSINHPAVLAILPFRQTRNDASSNRLQLT